MRRMAKEHAEVARITSGVDLGNCKAKPGDFSRGWIDDVPTDSYEGGLDEPRLEYDVVEEEFVERHRGTEWPGYLSAEDYKREQGPDAGFVRRPLRRGDVERS